MLAFLAGFWAVLLSTSLLCSLLVLPGFAPIVVLVSPVIWCGVGELINGRMSCQITCESALV